jgi:predicted secreted protein
MASSAFLGKGTQIQYENPASPGTYLTFAEARSISGPSLEGAEVEVTSMDSPGRLREFIGGLVDPGGVDFEVNYIPSNATHQQILADLVANPAPVRNMRVRFAQLTPVRRLDFAGFILSAPLTIPVDSQVTQNVRIRATGLPTSVQE